MYKFYLIRTFQFLKKNNLFKKILLTFQLIMFIIYFRTRARKNNYEKKGPYAFVCIIRNQLK